MLDRKFIIQNLEMVRDNCAKRRALVDVDSFVRTEKARLNLERRLQQIQQEMNRLAKQRSVEAEVDHERAKELKREARLIKADLVEVAEKSDILLKQIPNLTHPDSPIGEEANSQEIYRSKYPKPNFDYAILDHKDLGEELGMLDMDSGTKVAKPGFYFIKGDLALLEIALMRFALDRVMEAGYELLITPDVANDKTMEGTGYFPRGDESNTFTLGHDGLNLIATSEIVLCGMYADTTINEEDLPVRVAGLSHCFRTERAAGRATRGLYRVHQFQKVEMVAICKPEDGERLHNELLAIEKKIFEDLELPFRIIDIASGDLGAPAYRKYDLEAWMPKRGDGGEFGEVTSTSNCTDYQARRLNIKYKMKDTNKNAFVYTLNGTGLAIGRAMIALLENNQQLDRSVRIPKKLQPYFGKETIRAR
ncbi:serine--tRNA ligase [Sphingorhabdus sp. IMCC26285]|uniref:Serine--tRNA ligase n=1 Tax=Sphingorhabdus profundilacus TaxID=2509718 RepID=A0A6I4LYU8_9SPHN|nr:serine--tRNA ligase [Sphingorhabdus profundilacus]MVZ98059.1 serine--tRNA ligase [Sphingorhabdus profundilacus]